MSCVWGELTFTIPFENIQMLDKGVINCVLTDCILLFQDEFTEYLHILASAKG